MLVAEPIGFLKRFFTPRTVFMEIGAKDCALALSAASYVERVYAVEAAEPPRRSRRPLNLRLVTASGVAHESVDVAYSARPRLRGTRALERIYRSLAPGGTFVLAPSSEYSTREIREVFLRAGFRALRLYAGIGGSFVRVPFALERLFGELRIAAVK